LQIGRPADYAYNYVVSEEVVFLVTGMTILIGYDRMGWCLSISESHFATAATSARTNEGFDLTKFFKF
jgi:hypothetical protein